MLFSNHKKFRIYFLVILMIVILVSTGMTIYLFNSNSKSELISLFPIKHYDQAISNWIKPTDHDYDQPLLTKTQQKIRYDELWMKFFGARSPWSIEYINKVYDKKGINILKLAEKEKLANFNNQNKSDKSIQYGSNYIPHPKKWIDDIEKNMNLQQFSNKQYQEKYRAIAIDNLQGRVLPTYEVSFNSHKIAGQGYPFDNLQASTIWAGTPLYILGETHDHSWYLVQTPNFIAWVNSTGVALAGVEFVKNWQEQAKKNMAAIINTQISMTDEETHSFRFHGYIGMLFPAISQKTGIKILIPVADIHRYANIHHVKLSNEQAIIMPLLPTPHHFVKLINQLIGRPYGWGGMYKHSDCSAELKNLFLTFGILLPMHSTNQVDPQSFNVKQIDLSNLNMDERLAYLRKHGHKFMTIVYVGGHVLLYLGDYKNPNNLNENQILTYQEMWGLKTKTEDSRLIIGKSVLFPLLNSYPENTNIIPQANKDYFQLGYLDFV